MKGKIVQGLVGYWRLVGVKAWDAAGSPLPSPFGDAPLGMAVFTADGWMTANVCHAAMPPGRAFVAYQGQYVFDGATLTTQVVAATFPDWVGGAQVRQGRFEGEDRLFLRPPLRELGGRAVQQELEWVRLR